MAVFRDLACRARGVVGRAGMVLLVWTVAARAQTVAGTVTDARSALPIAGAVVSVADAAGQSSTRTVTDARGQFVVPVSPDTKELQFRRIGFRPQNVPVPDSVRMGKGPGSISVALQPIPQTLDPVTVDGGCPSNATAGQALAFWEQAQAGFLGAAVSRDENRASVRVLRFERDVLIDNNAVVQFAVSKHDTVSAKTFGAARTPAEFAARGYIEETSALRVWYAPDVDVLLDGSFRHTHCFSLAKTDREHPNQVGIVFQPAMGRDKIPDVRGTLWIDRSPLALRQLDFAYAGGGPPHRSGETGGRLSFRTADNGAIVIDDWVLRADAVFAPSGAAPLQSLHETGGALISATWRDGTILRRQLPMVTGTVTDAQTKQPIANVWVMLPNTFYRSITNAAGAFRFDDMLPGDYPLRMVDSSLSDFGLVRSGAVALKVVAGQNKPVSAKLEEWTAAMQRRCSPLKREPVGGVLIARVVDQQGIPVKTGLEVDAKLTTEGLTSPIFGDLDREGRLTFCQLPRGTVDVDLLGANSVLHGTAAVQVSGKSGLDTVTIIMRPKG